MKLTGILSLGALQPGEVRKYGTTIAPGLYAPVHQHFFVARMDMAVDSKPGEALNQVKDSFHYIFLIPKSLLIISKYFLCVLPFYKFLYGVLARLLLLFPESRNSRLVCSITMLFLQHSRLFRWGETSS